MPRLVQLDVYALHRLGGGSDLLRAAAQTPIGFRGWPGGRSIAARLRLDGLTTASGRVWKGADEGTRKAFWRNWVGLVKLLRVGEGSSVGPMISTLSCRSTKAQVESSSTFALGTELLKAKSKSSIVFACSKLARRSRCDSCTMTEMELAVEAMVGTHREPSIRLMLSRMKPEKPTAPRRRVRAAASAPQ